MARDNRISSTPPSVPIPGTPGVFARADAAGNGGGGATEHAHADAGGGADTDRKTCHRNGHATPGAAATAPGVLPEEREALIGGGVGGRIGVGGKARKLRPSSPRVGLLARNPRRRRQPLEDLLEPGVIAEAWANADALATRLPRGTAPADRALWVALRAAVDLAVACDTSRVELAQRLGISAHTLDDRCKPEKERPWRGAECARILFGAALPVPVRDHVVDRLLAGLNARLTPAPAPADPVDTAPLAVQQLQITTRLGAFSQALLDASVDGRLTRRELQTLHERGRALLREAEEVEGSLRAMLEREGEV